MQSELQGKVALVTGGSAGIGKAIALKFALSAAHVIIFGTNEGRGQAAVEEISSEVTGASISFMQVDVSDHLAVKASIEHILKKYGKIDILVNNAGITRDQLLMKMSEQEWDAVMDVNVKSCYNTCHALVRPMMKQREGAIINISSVIGLLGNPAQVNYAASKAAMIGFTKALARELAPRNITVNCIAPGFIVTQMTDILSDQQKDATLQRIPLGRFGAGDDIAEAVLFLASKKAKYITGQVLAVDGGMAM
jgi:3-oxoacyl-[acyl-carrier protein] reductase